MIPPAIQEKASGLLEAIKHKRIRPRRSKKKKYKVINVSHRWRLVNKGRKWVLMTHEEYNKAVKR